MFPHRNQYMNRMWTLYWTKKQKKFWEDPSNPNPNPNPKP